MDAGIAPINTKGSANPAGRNFLPKEIQMAAPKKKANKRPSAPAPRERLKAVKPSGGKDDSFFDLVHEVARQIPKGRVTSYGAIATALGTKLSARMVGWAMLSAHHATPPVPAHRVVNRNGLLSGRPINLTFRA